MKWTSGPRTMLPCFNIKRAKYYSPNWFNWSHCLPFLGKVSQVLFYKARKINEVKKRKDGNCVEILYDHGGSNLGEYTIQHKRFLCSRSLFPEN